MLLQTLARKCYPENRRGDLFMDTLINQNQLKDLIKSALVEVLEERQDLIHDAVEQALEDIALLRAIEEGESSELIEREEVLEILEGKA
jgi:hypothetical protein